MNNHFVMNEFYFKAKHSSQIVANLKKFRSFQRTKCIKMKVRSLISIEKNTHFSGPYIFGLGKSKIANGTKNCF